MPERRSSASLILSSRLSASFKTRRTQSGGSPLVSKGRHRLHGRYPANTASRTLEKKFTFCGSGLLAGHEGRQKIPVVRTPRKNTPSYEASFREYARCISFMDGIVSMPTFFLCPAAASTDILTSISRTIADMALRMLLCSTKSHWRGTNGDLARKQTDRRASEIGRAHV